MAYFGAGAALEAEEARLPGTDRRDAKARKGVPYKTVGHRERFRYPEPGQSCSGVYEEQR